MTFFKNDVISICIKIRRTPFLLRKNYVLKPPKPPEKSIWQFLKTKFKTSDLAFFEKKANPKNFQLAAWHLPNEVWKIIKAYTSCLSNQFLLLLILIRKLTPVPQKKLDSTSLCTGSAKLKSLQVHMCQIHPICSMAQIPMHFIHADL